MGLLLNKDLILGNFTKQLLFNDKIIHFTIFSNS